MDQNTNDDNQNNDFFGFFYYKNPAYKIMQQNKQLKTIVSELNRTYNFNIDIRRLPVTPEYKSELDKLKLQHLSLVFLLYGSAAFFIFRFRKISFLNRLFLSAST